MKRIHSTASHLWYPTLLSEKINIPANGGKIAVLLKGSSVTAQPEAHIHFTNGVRWRYWCHSALKHSQRKSMGVTCDVMSHRSLFTLLAISHARSNPWPIEFPCTRCTTPTHIQSNIERSWYFCQRKYGCTTLNAKYSDTHAWRQMKFCIYSLTVTETVKGGRYLQRQGHRVKWSRRWREVSKSDWMQ